MEGDFLFPIRVSRQFRLVTGVQMKGQGRLGVRAVRGQGENLTNGYFFQRVAYESNHPAGPPQEYARTVADLLHSGKSLPADFHAP